MVDNQGRGEWVVGLNPDDRAPNDWLRMVARVFAAYRNKPLKESIVVYIDGLNVAPESPAIINGKCEVDISPGQTFIDDQFIGFIDPSVFTWEADIMHFGVEYCIVMQYQWINQMPPQTPSFNFIKSSEIHEQQMLCLAKAYINEDRTVVTIVDNKVPWYREMTIAAAGNTEVDGPELLPYVVAIKGASDISMGEDNPGGAFPENPDDSIGSLDIGWALDFHHQVGNQINYNSRLHTDGVNDGILYINNNRIINEIDPNGPSIINDPSDLGDSYIGIGNNITIIDINDENGILGNVTSDSGAACMTLKTEYHSLDTSSTTTAPEYRAGKIYFNHDNTSLNLQNRSEYLDANTHINTLSLTDETDLVTINGHPIWHANNLASTGKNIMFIGYRAVHPEDRDLPVDSTLPNELQDGDTYYNSQMHTYWYYYRDDNAIPPVAKWVEVGRSDAFKNYQEIIAIDGTNFLNIEYNPAFVQVSVGGAILSDLRGDYFTDTEGETIQFSKPLRKGEVVNVLTIFQGQTVGLSLNQINDVDITNVQDNDSLVYNINTLRWKNKPITVGSLDDIGDVSTAGASVGAGLKFNGTDWVADNAAQMQLGDLGNVNLINTSPVQGQALMYDGAGTWSNGWQMQPGTVVSFANEVAPSGYISCDGSALNTITFASLFDAIGYRYGGSGTTFRVPDLRGEFIRGIDNGRGIDPGRTFGSHQADAIRNIRGTIGNIDNGTYDTLFLQNSPLATGAFETTYGTYHKQDAQMGQMNGVGSLTFDASLTVPTADENRPYNMALLTCIKY